MLNVLQTESEEVWALAKQTTPGRGEATPGPDNSGITLYIILPGKYRFTGLVSCRVTNGAGVLVLIV